MPHPSYLFISTCYITSLRKEEGRDSLAPELSASGDHPVRAFSSFLSDKMDLNPGLCDKLLEATAEALLSH